MSKNSDEFFKGLKTIAAIHAVNDNPRKRDISKRILHALCIVLPSYIRPNEDEYEYNMSKIDAAVKKNSHPLLLKQMLDSRQKVELGTPSRLSLEGHRVKPRFEETGEDEVRVISIESIDRDPGGETPAQARQDGIEDGSTVEIPVDDIPSLGGVSTEIEESRISTGENIEEEKIDDDWFSAERLTFDLDKSILFDQDGKAENELDKGLSFINPIEREQEIDRQYSSASGYHDLYQGNTATATFTREMVVAGTLKRQPASQFIGERCGMDDGNINEEDINVYQCPNCFTCLHIGCARVVIEYQHGICPKCGASLDGMLQ